MGDWVAIVNPAAAHGKCAKRAASAIGELTERGLSVSVRHTQAPGDGVRLARRALDEGYTRLIAVGGDGTANEVVNGVAPVRPDGTVTLATIPLGTANSFLRDFGQQEIAAALAEDSGPSETVLGEENAERASTKRQQATDPGRDEASDG